MKDFKLPDLGEGIAAGDVVQVLVAEGATIAAEQAVVELETDKAVVEVPCPFAGKVVKVHVKTGDKVPVGATLITVDTGDGTGPAGPAETEAPTVAAEQPPKPTPGPPSAPGPEDATTTKPVPPPVEAAKMPSSSTDEPVPAGPATRRLARELGVDLTAVAARNPGARLTEEHVKAFVRDAQTARTASVLTTSPVGVPAATVPAPPLPDFSQWGPIQRVPFSSLQRKTAEHLSTGWRLAPHVTQFDEADVTALEALRQRFRQTEQGQHIRLTVTAFVLKAVAIALKTYPQFNASLDEQANELILKHYYHIGMAVDTEAGLIVPVLRDLDRKTVREIAVEMSDLAERTRQRKIGLDELRGGTFTVTNLGGIGGTAFTPVINYPEVAILGLARSRNVPVVEGGELKTRIMLPLCLSYDHRVINGADGARFARKLATLLEDPEILLLGG